MIKLWYMSFASEAGFLGAAVLEVPDGTDPITHSHMLGINPGGEVMFGEIPLQFAPPIAARNRLLSLAECEQHFGPMEKV